MALKFKISEAAFKKLTPELQAEYKEAEGGDGYTLDVSGLDDTGALKRAKDREIESHKETKAKLAEAEEKITELESGQGNKDKDIKTLEKTWQKKVDDEKKAGEDKLSKRDAFIKKNLIDSTAAQIAAEISTAPGLMSKALKERMTVEFDGDEPKLRILDAKGAPSDLTIEQLKQETLANKEYAAIIVASRASGSGAGSNGLNKNGGSAPSLTQNDKPVPLIKQSAQEIVAAIKAKKAAQ